MGRHYIEHPGGDTIYCCSQCHTPLANKKMMKSDKFTGSTGRAYLFDTCLNVTKSGTHDKRMMTGMHTIRNIYCKVCNSELGWIYEFAVEDGQRYKEGNVILEKSLIREVKGFDEDKPTFHLNVDLSTATTRDLEEYTFQNKKLKSSPVSSSPVLGVGASGDRPSSSSSSKNTSNRSSTTRLAEQYSGTFSNQDDNSFIDNLNRQQTLLTQALTATAAAYALTVENLTNLDDQDVEMESDNENMATTTSDVATGTATTLSTGPSTSTASQPTDSDEENSTPLPDSSRGPSPAVVRVSQLSIQSQTSPSPSSQSSQQAVTVTAQPCVQNSESLLKSTDQKDKQSGSGGSVGGPIDGPNVEFTPFIDITNIETPILNTGNGLFLPEYEVATGPTLPARQSILNDSVIETLQNYLQNNLGSRAVPNESAEAMTNMVNQLISNNTILRTNVIPTTTVRQPNETVILDDAINIEDGEGLDSSQTSDDEDRSPGGTPDLDDDSTTSGSRRPSNTTLSRNYSAGSRAHTETYRSRQRELLDAVIAVPAGSVGTSSRALDSREFISLTRRRMPATTSRGISATTRTLLPGFPSSTGLPSVGSGPGPSSATAASRARRAHLRQVSGLSTTTSTETRPFAAPPNRNLSEAASVRSSGVGSSSSNVMVSIRDMSTYPSLLRPTSPNILATAAAATTTNPIVGGGSGGSGGSAGSSASSSSASAAAAPLPASGNSLDEQLRSLMTHLTNIYRGIQSPSPNLQRDQIQNYVQNLTPERALILLEHMRNLNMITDDTIREYNATSRQSDSGTQTQAAAGSSRQQTGTEGAQRSEGARRGSGNGEGQPDTGS